MIQDETINLRTLLIEVYEEKNKDIEEEKRQDKDNFVRDQTDKLKEILCNLRVDLEKLRKNYGDYEIPIVTAEVFKQYLLENSSKGSFVSKIKNGQLYEITANEKMIFIEKVIAGLKQRINTDNQYEISIQEIDDIRNTLVSQLYFFEKINAKMKNTKLLAKMMIESGFICIGGLTGFEGMIIANDDIYYDNMKDDEKEFEKLKNVSDGGKYRIDLSQTDREELIDYFSIMLKNTFNDWKQIADIACEIRSENILEENKKYIESNDLIKMAINEYKEDLNNKHEIKNNFEKIKNNREEMKKILEEIKLENKRGKESSH